MPEMQALLVEIGTEELPPKALPELARAFFDGVCAGLDKRNKHFVFSIVSKICADRIPIPIPPVVVHVIRFGSNPRASLCGLVY